MKNKMFDDQHQPLSSWLDKLATDESTKFSDSDLKEEDIVEKKQAEFKGISTTWDTKKEIEAPILDDTSREVSNKPTVEESVDDVEKQAKQLIMTGIGLEKLSTVLKRRFAKELVDKFLTEKSAVIENEFGKLGCIYVDASLVSDCNDLSEILKSASKISSIAIRSVKKIAKCADCNFNKRSHCLKLSLDVVDEPVVKTAKEAKSIINKFASLKYINSYFVRSEDLTQYYDRLASENPDKVVKSFLCDIENRRQAKQTTGLRLAASESTSSTTEKKAHTVKFGKEDIEIASAFKQFLLQNQSLRAAKSTLTQRYGEDRIKSYLKEAREDVDKYIKFVSAKPKTASLRDESVVESDAATLENKQSAVRTASAIKMAYSLKTFRQPLEEIQKNIAKTYGADIAKQAMDKLSNDTEARLLGLTYIDSNLYSNASEMKDVLNILKRKSNNTIYQIKEGNACKLANNPEGVCSVTGLEIVKDASVNTKEAATNLLNHLQNVKFANEYEISKIASNLNGSDNSKIIASFISSRKPAKVLPSKVVKQAADVAFKYAKDLPSIRKIARMSWTSSNLLVEALESNVVNKQAFAAEVNSIFNKSASDANTFLNNQPNQYNTNIFTDDKEQVSDVILGSTI